MPYINYMCARIHCKNGSDINRLVAGLQPRRQQHSPLATYFQGRQLC